MDESRLDCAVGSDRHLTARQDSHVFLSTGPSLETSTAERSVPRELEDIAILDFFSRDPRPIFILDLHTSNIAFHNDALASHLRVHKLDHEALAAWARSTPFNDSSVSYDFGARAWSAMPIAGKWLVVSACCCDHSSKSSTRGHSGGPALAPHLAVRTQPEITKSSRRGHRDHSTSDSESNASSDTRRGSIAPSKASSSWRTVSEDGLGLNAHCTRRLDWTRHNVHGLSAHLQLVQKFAWQDTPIGDISTWPDTLRLLVLSMMSNSEPRVVMWGEERRMIYNEACSLLFGQKHPGAMGARADEIWSESWQDLIHIVRRAEVEGKSTRISKMPLTMNRHGYAEETHWTLQMLPVIGPEGQVLGVLDEFAEITEHVLQERRREMIVKVNQMVASVGNMKELCSEFLEGLETCHEDVPYALLYMSDLKDNKREGNEQATKWYTLEGSIGLTPEQTEAPPLINFAEPQGEQRNLAYACRQAWTTGDDVVLQHKDGTLPEELAVTVSCRVDGERVKTVCVLPVPNYDGGIVAFLIIGMSPHRPYDSGYALFVHYLRDILAKSASAIVLPEDQRRARQKFEEIETSLAHQLRATALEAEKIEARYARMSQIAPVGMYAISTSSVTLFYNEAYLNITGITREEAEDSRRDPKDAIHPDDRDRVNVAFIRCLEEKQPFTAEYRVLKPRVHIDPATGEEIIGETWVLATAMPEIDETGEISHVQGWLLDISDRKEHERLRIKRAHNEKAEARFVRLAETAPLGMFLLQIDGQPIYLNDAYFELLGFTRSDFEEAQSRGLGWADRIHEDDQQQVGEAWLALVQDGVPLNLEYRIKKPWKAYDTATGTEMSGPTWLQGTAVAEMDEDGRPVAVQGFVTEISLKKFSERLLTERLADALETKQQADRFIDMVSHEIRNPLSAILQSADGILTSLESAGIPILNEDMTLSNDSAETVIDSAQTIILCAQHQKRIVDDILTLSKLDSNLLVISPDRISATSLLGKTFKMYEAELARSTIKASLVLEESYRQLAIGDVMLDSSRLLQVVINLVTNAIKFTQYCDKREINIYLGASLSRPASNSHCASFIPPRANRPDHTASPEWGTGDEVYLHVAVEDSGRGLTEEELKSLFQRFQQASPKTYKQYGGSGLGLFISRELSELQGGQIGVSSEAGKGSTFAFYVKARRCVMNVVTPAQNGRLPTPTLGSSPVSYTRGTAYASMDGTIQEESTDMQAPQSHSSGNASHLKRAATVVNTLDMQHGPLHVLVVEDNLVNQRVMAQQLKRLGCVVHVANHGVEALEFLQRTTFWNHEIRLQAASLEPMALSSPPLDSEALVPLSVILMDLEMPVLGGLGCVKQIRDMQGAGQLISHVPVIAVTANARNEQIAVAIEHGMDSVVTKPFRIPELVPQMQDLVNRVRAVA